MCMLIHLPEGKLQVNVCVASAATVLDLWCVCNANLKIAIKCAFLHFFGHGRVKYYFVGIPCVLRWIRKSKSIKYSVAVWVVHLLFISVSGLI